MSDSYSPNHELAILQAVARKLSSSVELQESLAQTLSQVAELLALETGWIFLLDEHDAPYLAASQNLPEGLQLPERMCGSCYCLDVFRADELHSARNVSIIACSRLYKLSPEAAGGLRFHASIPLQAGGTKLGVMNVASRQKQALSPDDLNILYTIGDLLSLAIQRNRYHEEHLRLSALNERFRMARELHDSLGQGLAALIMRLETLDALSEKITDDTRMGIQNQVQHSLGLARNTLREARHSVQNLRSPEAEPVGLELSLRRLIQELLPGVNVSLTIRDSALSAAFSPSLSHGLYRMLQELLTNIHKHARATAVDLEIEPSAEGLQVLVQDNGVGFEPDQVPAGHFGLIGLRERVHLLGGCFALESSLGQGTEVRIVLPEFLPQGASS